MTASDDRYVDCAVDDGDVNDHQTPGSAARRISSPARPLRRPPDAVAGSIGASRRHGIDEV